MTHPRVQGSLFNRENCIKVRPLKCQGAVPAGVGPPLPHLPQEENATSTWRRCDAGHPSSLCQEVSPKPRQPRALPLVSYTSGTALVGFRRVSCPRGTRHLRVDGTLAGVGGGHCWRGPLTSLPASQVCELVGLPGALGRADDHAVSPFLHRKTDRHVL